MWACGLKIRPSFLSAWSMQLQLEVIFKVSLTAAQWLSIYASDHKVRSSNPKCVIGSLMGCQPSTRQLCAQNGSCRTCESNSGQNKHEVIHFRFIWFWGWPHTSWIWKAWANRTWEGRAMMGELTIFWLTATPDFCRRVISLKRHKHLQTTKCCRYHYLAWKMKSCHTHRKLHPSKEKKNCEERICCGITLDKTVAVFLSFDSTHESKTLFSCSSSSPQRTPITPNPLFREAESVPLFSPLLFCCSESELRTPF